MLVYGGPPTIAKNTMIPVAPTIDIPNNVIVVLVNKTLVASKEKVMFPKELETFTFANQ
jgi:hypothetical protein